MTTAAITLSAAPAPLLSAQSRALAAVLISCVLSLAWVTTEQASHEAVRFASHSIAAAGQHAITLSRVEIVGRRQPA